MRSAGRARVVRSAGRARAGVPGWVVRAPRRAWRRPARVAGSDGRSGAAAGGVVSSGEAASGSSGAAAAGSKRRSTRHGAGAPVGVGWAGGSGRVTGGASGVGGVLSGGGLSLPPGGTRQRRPGRGAAAQVGAIGRVEGGRHGGAIRESREGQVCDPSVAGSRGPSGLLAGRGLGTGRAVGVAPVDQRWSVGGRLGGGSQGDVGRRLEGRRQRRDQGRDRRRSRRWRTVRTSGPQPRRGAGSRVPPAVGRTAARPESASGETAVGRRRCRQAAAAPAAAAPASAAIGASCRARRARAPPSSLPIGAKDSHRRAAVEVARRPAVGWAPAEAVERRGGLARPARRPVTRAPATRCRTAASGRRVHGPGRHRRVAARRPAGCRRRPSAGATGAWRRLGR